MAVEAARSNVAAPAERFHLGDAWRSVPSELRFDWIVSNPPVHCRRQDDFGVVEALVEGSAQRLLLLL